VGARTKRRSGAHSCVGAKEALSHDDVLCIIAEAEEDAQRFRDTRHDGHHDTRADPQ
jgi:hypothetical protein